MCLKNLSSFAFSCLACCSLAQAEREVDCATLTLAQPEQRVEARFAQERRIAALSKPLQSSGSFSLVPGEEIVWNTTAPIQSRVVIRNEGIEVASGGSAYHEQLDERRFQELSRLLLSLHSLEEKTLAEKFNLRCRVLPEGGFELRALPRQSALQRLLESVVIRGYRRPEHIRVTDARGEVTEVELFYLDHADEQMPTSTGRN